MMRILGYGLLGYVVAGVGYYFDFSIIDIVVGLCLIFILVSIIERGVT